MDGSFGGFGMWEMLFIFLRVGHTAGEEKKDG